MSHDPGLTRDRSGVVVRPAAPDDAAGIARVHVRGWQVGYRGLVPDEVLDALDPVPREQAWYDRLRRPGPADATTLVATAGGDVVGFASHGPGRDDDTPPGGHELWALYVDPDRWRHGAGRALDRAVADALVAAGARSATLWVLSANTRARRFYESRGWRVEGATRVDRRPGPPTVDLLETRYVRSLAD